MKLQPTRGIWIIFNAFKENSIPEKKNKKPKTSGKKIFQPIYINWSNRNLGKFALTKINKNVIIIVLIEKTRTHTVDSIKIPSGKIYCNNKEFPPERKKITNKEDINKIFAYSPKKNAANIIAEYSTLYPATSSASASGKSKGALFVSANIEIKKIIAIGNNGKISQTVSCCINIIIFRFNEPLNKITGKKIKLIDTSYEIICETDRKAPISANLELLAQPDKRIP